MADKKKSAKPKKQPAGAVFDVAKPGARGIQASPTSRPVIIKHDKTPDPMVNETRRDDLEPKPLLKPAKKLVIKPLDDNDNDGMVDVTASAKSTPVPVAATDEQADVSVKTAPPLNEPIPTEPVEVQVTNIEDTAVAEEPAVTIADVAGDIDAGVPAAAEQRAEDSKAARERAKRLQQMIDDEEYFLPIETLEERRSRRVAVLGLLLIIVLAAAWYNVALDANLLPNSFNLPHTHFFTVQP